MQIQDKDDILPEEFSEEIIEVLIEQYAVMLNDYIETLFLPLSTSEEKILIEIAPEERGKVEESLFKVLEFASALEVWELYDKASYILEFFLEKKD